eukprot:1299972-Rhodomonas_salina.4
MECDIQVWRLLRHGTSPDGATSRPGRQGRSLPRLADYDVLDVFLRAPARRAHVRPCLQQAQTAVQRPVRVSPDQRGHDRRDGCGNASPRLQQLCRRQLRCVGRSAGTGTGAREGAEQNLSQAATQPAAGIEAREHALKSQFGRARRADATVLRPHSLHSHR